MNAATEVPADVVDRLLKIAALRESPNPHEAAAAAAKLQELLHQHNLTMADLPDGSPRQRASGFTTRAIRLERVKWREMLMSVLCACNWCRGVRRVGTSDSTIFGAPENVAIVWHLYGYLASEIERLAQLWRQTLKPRNEMDTRHLLKSFRIGAAEVVCYHLQEQFKADMRNNAASTALAVDMEAALNDAHRRLFPEVPLEAKTAKPLSGDEAARTAGRLAALGITWGEKPLTSGARALGSGQ